MYNKVKIRKNSIKLLSIGLAIPVVCNAHTTIENGKLKTTDIADDLKIESLTLFEKSESLYSNDEDVYRTVADIPKFYREQLLKSGIKESTPLFQITSLELDIDDSSSAIWLCECRNLRSLHINFMHDVDPEAFAFYKDLPFLTDLTISTTKTKYFESMNEWQNDQKRYSRELFYDLYQSGFDSSINKYFNTVVIDVAIDPNVFSFLERCPNITKIEFVGFSYGKDTDISWLKRCKNLQNLIFKPYFKNYWNLDQMKDIIENLIGLKSLRIRTNSYLMTDSDFSLISHLARFVDIARIEYSGLMPDESFRYTKENGRNIFSPGLGDRIDYADLSDMDVLDLSTVGLYNGLIYMDSTMYNYLLAQGTTIKLSFEYDLEFLEKEISTLDRIYAGLKIADGDSDYEKLIKVLNYVTKTYRYGNTNTSLDLKEKYYHEGPLYGAMNGTYVVCGNYAAMSCTLLERANVETYYIRNRIHAWILVKIDGSYYYIDPTLLSGNYRYYIDKGYREIDAFQKAVSGKSIFIDPYDKIALNEPPTKKDPYSDAKIPYWIDPFRSIYERKNKPGKSLEL